MSKSPAGRFATSLRRARRGAAPAALAALAAALVSGCAGWAPGEAERVVVAPTVVPPERLERLVALADAEWRRWGGRIVRLDGEAGACLDLPDGCVEVPDGCGDEQSAPLCPAVNAYWRLVPPFVERQQCQRTDVCTTAWTDAEPRAPRSAPWSAAFVSATMRRAGFSRTEFRFDMAHAAYVVAAREGWTSAYEVLPTPAAAAPGDLICAMRGESDLTPQDIAAIADRPRRSPMHCDIVVAVDTARGVLEAIGGNVQQTVAKTIAALDAEGRVAFDTDPGRRWILVMRARRAPPEPPLP